MDAELVSPQGTQAGKTYLASSSHQPVATPHSEPWGNSGCENAGHWPRQLRCYEMNVFREPRLLHLPTHRKALNSWTWVIWLSLISNTLLTYKLPSLCCKTSVSPGSPTTLYPRHEAPAPWQSHSTPNALPATTSQAPKSLQMVTAAMKLKDACSLEEDLWPP